MSTETLVRFRGVDKSGAKRTGVVSDDDVAEMVQRSYVNGWRWLQVTRGRDVVGAVTMSHETGRRVCWWEA